MKKCLVSLCLLLSVISVMCAQSAKTNVISFKLEDVQELYMPPELSVDVQFMDKTNDGILEALEEATLRLNISNKGGSADNVHVSIIPSRHYADLFILKQNVKTKVAKNSSTVVDIPIKAGVNVNDSLALLVIKIKEAQGYSVNTQLNMAMSPYSKSKLELLGVKINDSGFGNSDTKTIDNKIQNGETVTAEIAIQNIGEGIARNITYEVFTKDPNIFIVHDTGLKKIKAGSIKQMKVGEVHNITFRVSVNNEYKQSLLSSYLPIYITATEDMGFGDIKQKILGIPFNAVPEKIQVRNIQANYDKLAARKRTEVVSDKRKDNGSERINVHIAPNGKKIFGDAMAIVIGVEDFLYDDLPPAPYAANDADLIAKYFSESMKISDVKVYKNDEVTKTKLEDILSPSYGLGNVTDNTDLFLYFSGHGTLVDDANGKQDIYLLPYDVRRDKIKERGYSLNKLYTDLNNIGAKSVTVFLDACFSGGTRSSGYYKQQSITNQKLVRVKVDEMEQPWLENKNFRVFTSSSGEQTSLASDASETGLFTYFLALGMQGQSDENKDGIITIGELVKYVQQNVAKEALKMNSSNQNPQFYGNTDFTIEKF